MGSEAEPCADRASCRLKLTAQAADLYPITLAYMACHIWGLARPKQHGGWMETAVIVAQIAAKEGKSTGFACFACVAISGAAGAAR